MQGGAVDMMPTSIGPAIDHVRAGRLKVLGVFDVEQPALLPDAPLVVNDYPDIAKLLPWGSFFGVFVAEGTPEEAVTALQEAFQTAAASPEFGELMQERGFTLMNISGDAAEQFLDRYRSVSSWIVWDGGFGVNSPRITASRGRDGERPARGGSAPATRRPLRTARVICPCSVFPEPPLSAGPKTGPACYSRRTRIERNCTLPV
jgi:hypothetical protein